LAIKSEQESYENYSSDNFFSIEENVVKDGWGMFGR